MGVRPCAFSCSIYVAIALLTACAPTESAPQQSDNNALTGTSSGGAASPPSSASGTPGLSALAKHKAEMLTSIWENSTTVLQYGYCENIGDGRGYTSGRAGFCSGTGDAILVVKCLVSKLGAASAMAKYVPPLTTITNAFESSGHEQADTSAIDAVGSYCKEWSATATDATAGSAFRSCQDDVVTSLYFEPAVAHAKRLGLTTALTIAELYDAEINHGPDGVDDLIAKTNADVGISSQTPASAPVTREAESTWLHAFLLRRVKVLQADPTWRDAVDRVATYERMRLDGNFDMGAAIRTDAKAKALFNTVTGLRDSGYPKCTISPTGAVSGDEDCTNPSPEK